VSTIALHPNNSLSDNKRRVEAFHFLELAALVEDANKHHEMRQRRVRENIMCGTELNLSASKPAVFSHYYSIFYFVLWYGFRYATSLRVEAAKFSWATF
jgi:hypothetical protein